MNEKSPTKHATLARFISDGLSTTEPSHPALVFYNVINNFSAERSNATNASDIEKLDLHQLAQNAVMADFLAENIKDIEKYKKDLNLSGETDPQKILTEKYEEIRAILTKKTKLTFFEQAKAKLGNFTKQDAILAEELLVEIKKAYENALEKYQEKPVTNEIKVSEEKKLESKPKKIKHRKIEEGSAESEEEYKKEAERKASEETIKAKKKYHEKHNKFTVIQDSVEILQNHINSLLPSDFSQDISNDIQTMIKDLKNKTRELADDLKKVQERITNFSQELDNKSQNDLIKEDSELEQNNIRSEYTISEIQKGLDQIVKHLENNTEKNTKEITKLENQIEDSTKKIENLDKTKKTISGFESEETEFMKEKSAQISDQIQEIISSTREQIKRETKPVGFWASIWALTFGYSHQKLQEQHKWTPILNKLERSIAPENTVNVPESVTEFMQKKENEDFLHNLPNQTLNLLKKDLLSWKLSHENTTNYNANIKESDELEDSIHQKITETKTAIEKLKAQNTAQNNAAEKIKSFLETPKEQISSKVALTT